MINRIATIFLCLFLFSNMANPVHADTPIVPRDYSVESQNGHYIFVMLVPENMNGIYNPREGAEKNTALRSAYQQSGMYDAKTGNLMWPVSWYSYEVTVLNDGEHVINWGGPFFPQSDGYNLHAVSFHKNGQTIKRLLVSDLVYFNAELPKSVSHYHWRRHFSINESIKQIMIETHSNEIYKFNYSSGKLTAKTTDKNHAVLPWSLEFGIIGLCNLSALVYTWTRRRSHEKS